MKKFLSFLWKLLLILAVIFILALGAIEMLKDKVAGGDDVTDSLAEIHKNDWVDLGLPSGLLWGKDNVGGTSWSGDTNYLFAWGDTAYRDRSFRWSTYRFTEGDRKPQTPSMYDSGPGDYGKLTKYCTNPKYGKDGVADNLTTLQPEDDAATVGWGKGARIPTSSDWLELKKNTTQRWEKRGDIGGMVFTGSNGNSIFLPAVGYSNDGWLDGYGTYGSYWTNEISDVNIPLVTSNHDTVAVYDATLGAKCFDFDSFNYSSIRTVYRYHGLSVRAVRSTK